MITLFKCLVTAKKSFMSNKRLLNAKISPGHQVYKVIHTHHMDNFKQLTLNEKSIELLYECFKRIDTDNNGYICKYEFFNYLKKQGMTKTRFSKKLFHVFDLSDQGEIDFHNFVLCCWNFLPIQDDAKLRLAFVLYDTDRSGYLCEKEILKVIKTLYGKEKYKDHPATEGVISTLLNDYNGEVDYIRFTRFVKQYPILLWPTASLQINLRAAIMGIDFWEQATYNRIQFQENTKQKYSNIKKGPMRFKDLVGHLNSNAADIDTESFNNKLLHRSSFAFLNQGLDKVEEEEKGVPETTSDGVQKVPTKSKSNEGIRKPHMTLTEKIKMKEKGSRRRGVRKGSHALPPAMRPKYFKGRRRSTKPKGNETAKYAWTCTICGHMNPSKTLVCRVCACSYATSS